MSSFFSKPCPRCGKTSLYLMTERSLQGNTILTCNECGWIHSEPNYKCLDFNGMYDNGYAEYNKFMASKPEPVKAYPDEKSERELLEEILVKLKEIKQQIILVPRRTGFEKYEDPRDRIAEKYEKNSDLITTPPGFKAPNIMCAVKEEETNECN